MQLLSTMLLSLLMTTAQTSPTGHRVVGDIEYGIANGQRLLLDVHQPTDANDAPVVLVIHGGGWIDGDKAADVPFIADFVDAGFVCFSINYRMAPQHPWPACMEDVRTAHRWIAEHAPSYGGDPDRIAVAGYSAGGHLALHVAATATEDDPPILAAVGFAPPTDMVIDNFRRGELSRSMKALLAKEEVDEQALLLLWEISPINHLTPDAPPHILVHGTADPGVPYYLSVYLQQRLEDLGVPCELITLEGAGHHIREWPQTDPTYARKVAERLTTLLKAAE